MMDITELNTTSRFGRHLLLRRSVSAATVVLEHPPYAAVLYDNEVTQRCDLCFVPSDKLMKCSRSKFAHYCSVAHQRVAWKAYYRKECKALRACAPHLPPATVRLAARVLWKRASEQAQQAPPPPVQQRLHQQHHGFYTDIELLESHWNLLEGTRKLLYAQMAVLTRRYMQGAIQQSLGAVDEDDSSLPDVKHIAQLLARFACNNHTVCDEELRPIGVGIYPLGALVNHSCTPNCVQSFIGPNIVFRSLRALPAGDQLTISYVELAATRQERRRQLLHQYFFDIDEGSAQPAAGRAAAEHTERQQQATDLASRSGSTLGDGAAQIAQARNLASKAASLCEQQEGFRIPLQHQVLLPDVGPDVEQSQLHSTASSSRGQTSAGVAAAADQSNKSSSSGSSTDCSCDLLSYPISSRPPWPEDKPDKQLCQVLLMLPAAQSQPAGDSSTAVPGVILPGGLCLFTQTPTAGEDAAVAAGLFADLEGTTKGGLAEVEREDDDPGNQEDVQADRCQAKTQQQQQQQQQVEVVHWGDWGAAAGDSIGGVVTTTDLARAAAINLVRIWGLQRHADQLASGGKFAAAAQTYQKALHAADGLPAADSIAGTGGSCCMYTLALGPKHILRSRLYAGLLKAAIDEGSMWEAALSAAQSLTPVYKLVYPEVWPNLGLHYALVAKLAAYLQQPAAAAQAAAAAGGILQVTHSGSSPVLQEVMRIRYEAQQELEAQ